MHFIGRLKTLEHDLTLLFEHLDIPGIETGISVLYASAEDTYKSSLDTV
jgi:hypothetical protein